MAASLSVKPRDEVFSISQNEPDATRPIFFDSQAPEPLQKSKPAPIAQGAPPGMIPVDQLPLDQQAEFYSQVQAAPPQPKVNQAAPSGMMDVVDAYKSDPKALAEFAVGTKGAFDLDAWAAENEDRMKDPQTAASVADAMAILQERGFNVRDINWKAAGNALLHLPLDIAKWGYRAQDLVQAQVDKAIAEKPMTPAEESTFKTEQNKRAAELVTGTNVGLEGLAGLIHKGVNKAARTVAEATGLRAKPTERTPEEKAAYAAERIEAFKRRELTARGNGILTQTFLGSVMKDLQDSGVKLDPEAVNTFAAGDPVTFAAFGQGFKLVGAGGRLLGSVSTKGQAIRAIEKLQAAQQIAAKAGYEHAAALETAGKLSDVSQSVAKDLASAAPESASPILAGAGEAAEQAVKTAEVAGMTAAQAEQAVARAAELAGQPLKGTIGHVARVADAALNVADWAKKATASIAERGTDFVLSAGAGAAGVAAKAAQFGTWAIRGLTPDLAAPPLLKAAPKVLGAIGDKALQVSSSLLKNAPERFGPVTQFASDAAKAATVDAATGVVKGGLMDYTLAAITNETPTENANSGVMMSALGGLEGLRFGAGRLVKGQMTAPHNYGSEVPVRNLGNFADLDAATELSLKTSEKSPGVTRRLAAMREFFGPANTELYYVSDPQQFADVLHKYVPGMTEENIAKARNAGGVNIPNVEIPGTGKTRNLAIFNELSAAEHEGIHGWQNVFSTAGRQKLNQLARTEYAQEWERIGDGYANRFLTPEQRMGYAQRGEGWREALLDFTQGSPEWRDEGWTPDQIRDTADNYIANEVVADVGGSILQSNRGNLEKAPGFPGKLARVLGKMMDVMGAEPFAGESTSQVGIPLKFGARENIRLGLRDAISGAGEDAIRAKFDAAKSPDKSPDKSPAKSPVSPTGEKIDSDEIAAAAPNEPTTRGGRTQREIAADLSTAIKSGAGVSIDYMSAPGEPAGAVTSNRVARRNIIEAFRTMPAEARALWEKTFFPEKLSRTQSGEIQVQGWSPEVFAANAHKLAAELHRAKAGDLTPYPIDPKTGSFTADGWRLLFDDTVQFSKNQMAGLTGAGESLVVPESMTEHGFTQPTELGEPGRKLNQDRADVISMLMGIPLPKTGRVGTVFPRNLAGQAVSEATQPGRTSLPVTPREFAGKNAAKFGVEGQPVKEVNPLRAELDLRGIKPDMIEAIQKLNLSHIADVTPNANLPVVRGREFTVQAGFAPKSGSEWAKLKPEEVLDEIKAGGQPLTRTAWEVGKSASPEDIQALRAAESAASTESRAALKDGKIDEAMQSAMAKQFFSEAIQMNEGKVLPEPAAFAPKTDAGKALEEKGYTLDHVGYPGFRSISVLKDGKTVGEILSSMKEDPEQAYIAGVDVQSDSRGQGIADALYRELFTDLQADGVTRVDGYVVHPAPIKTREKLLGEGMTNYYQQGKPISIEQALAAVTAKEVLGPRAVSALAPDVKFAPKKSDDLKFEPTSFGTASKAWIKPDGSVVQLGAQWHHDWLSEHPEVQAKYGFKVKPFEGNDTEADRSQAIKAGFGRVNFEPDSGTMTVEVRQKDWNKLRPAVEDLADANIDNIDKFKLHLLNEGATKAVYSRFASLFDADSNKEKLQRLTDVLESKANFAPKSQRGETEGLPGLDVPREYVTPAERATMTRQEVRDRFPEAVVPRANGETIPSDVINSPLYKKAKSEDEAVKLFADRLKQMAEQYKDNPEYELGSRWYSEFTPMLKKEFGKDADLMAELLAATSPQTGVETNFGYAFDALQSWKAGRFDKIIPKFEQGLAKMEDGSWETWLKRNDISGTLTPALFMAHWIEKNNLKPTQSNGKLYGQHSIPVMKVFARRWMDSNSGPKTKNFVGNLLGKSDEATIDLWADRTMRWAGYEGLQDRWRVLPENLHSVSDADYAFAEKAFHAAAADMKMKPSALQGALWFAEKKRWSDNGWGRLDLGNFQNEMEKLPLLRAGFEQRLATKKAKSKAKPTEQLGFDIQPRFK